MTSKDSLDQDFETTLLAELNEEKRLMECLFAYKESCRVSKNLNQRLRHEVDSIVSSQNNNCLRQQETIILYQGQCEKLKKRIENNNKKMALCEMIIETRNKQLSQSIQNLTLKDNDQIDRMSTRISINVSDLVGKFKETFLKYITITKKLNENDFKILESKKEKMGENSNQILKVPKISNSVESEKAQKMNANFLKPKSTAVEKENSRDIFSFLKSPVIIAKTPITHQTQNSMAPFKIPEFRMEQSRNSEDENRSRIVLNEKKLMNFDSPKQTNSISTNENTELHSHLDVQSKIALQNYYQDDDDQFQHKRMKFTQEIFETGELKNVMLDSQTTSTIPSDILQNSEYGCTPFSFCLYQDDPDPIFSSSKNDELDFNLGENCKLF